MKHPEDIISRLQEGNQRFINEMAEGNLQDQSRRNELIEGQHPYAIVLSCSDSRVVPEIAFDTGLGELFVVRVAGNIANTSSIASMEYAVAHTGTPVLIVLAHQSCGAVTSAVRGGDNGKNLSHLLAHIEPAIRACGEDASVDEVAIKNAELTAHTLITKSDIIAEAVSLGKLLIVQAYYHLDTGKVDFMRIGNDQRP